MIGSFVPCWFYHQPALLVAIQGRLLRWSAWNKPSGVQVSNDVRILELGGSVPVLVPVPVHVAVPGPLIMILCAAWVEPAVLTLLTRPSFCFCPRLLFSPRI